MAWSRDEKLAAYEALVAAEPGIERKGASMPYTSLNGNMFSFLSPGGELAFRLSQQDRDAFLSRFPGAVVVQHERLMKDYVEVPDAVLADPADLQRLFALSVANARTLKPKPTTRR